MLEFGDLEVGKDYWFTFSDTCGCGKVMAIEGDDAKVELDPDFVTQEHNGTITKTDIATRRVRIESITG